MSQTILQTVLQTILQTRKLSCIRDQRLLFDSLSFTLSPGEMLQVVGTNGSGKTTLLRCLAGLYTGYRGEIDWQLDEAPLYLGHKIGVKGSLDVRANMHWLTRLRNPSVTAAGLQEAMQALDLVGCEELPCEQLSEGQRKRVALAQFLLCDNPCWIMDEPMSAIDEKGLQFLISRMEQRLDSGGLVILASHQPVAIDRQVRRT